jgi:hypothetical protein
MAENEKATAKKAADKTGAQPKAEAKAKGTVKSAKAAADGPKCQADKCNQEVRAKGYCRKHFIAWRRAEVGKKHRYKICTKEGCRKPRVLGSLCDEHSGKGKPAEGAAA